MSDVPVYLRNIIVDPALACPQQYVGIQVVIVLQSLRLAAQRVAAFVAIDAKGRDTEFHPRLHLTDGLVQLLDECIYIIAAPVGLVIKAASVTGKAGIVRKIDSLNRVRIEIVVHVDGIDIVARNDIAHYQTDMTATFGQGRVEVNLVAISHKPLRMQIVHMIGHKLVPQRCLYPIRVDPRMKLHATLVALFNHKLHGIPIRFGGLSLYSRQIAAPGLQTRCVQGIRLGTYLKDDGVETCPTQ